MRNACCNLLPISHSLVGFLFPEFSIENADRENGDLPPEKDDFQQKMAIWCEIISALQGG